jgi:N-acetylmuramoyl-L-alanine amidase
MSIRTRTDALVLHCTASKFGKAQTIKQIRAEHTLPKSKGGYLGASDIGYHYVIGLGGETWEGRTPDNSVGAHVRNFNATTLGVSYVGGLSKETSKRYPQGIPMDTRSPDQVNAMIGLLKTLLKKYPKAVIVGHRDFSPDLNNDGKIEPYEWIKICPCFEAGVWAKSVGLPGATYSKGKYVLL